MPSFMPPKRVRNLPFNLLRNQAYPAAPWVVQQGIQDDQAGADVRVEADHYMPQKMGFNKWRTPPAGYNTQVLGMGAVNVIEARDGARRMLASLRDAGLGPAVASLNPIDQAADAYNDIPSVDSYLDMNPVPTSRGVLDRPDVQSNTDLMAIARGIAADPVGESQMTYLLPRGAPPRFPDVYRIRRY
jgi:hypothetical protein